MNNNQSTSLLDNLAVASPCTVSWDSMVGDNRARNCSGCKKTVYNISDMTKAEAESLLRDNDSVKCVKFYRRFDGTIVTDNCPRALRVVRDRFKMAAKIVFGMFAFCISLPAAFTQSLHNQSPMIMVPRNARYSLYFREVTYPASKISQQMNTSYMGDRVYIPNSGSLETSESPTYQNPTREPSVSVSARIVTKERSTPKGKVVLVDANEKEPVIQVQRAHLEDGLQSSEITETNQFVDTRVARYYERAKRAVVRNDIRLAKAYLIRALEIHEQQQNADPVFRKMITNELEKLQMTAEPARESKVSMDQSKTDESKADQSKTDQFKRVQFKTDQFKSDQFRSDPFKSDQSQTNNP